MIYKGDPRLEPIKDVNIQGKIMVLDGQLLDTSFQSIRHQLWTAKDGFGCFPGLRGTAVFCESLDGRYKQRLKPLNNQSMQSYTIITVLNNETIYEMSGLYPFKDFCEVEELQRERLVLDNRIHRIVIRGRCHEKTVTRTDEVKTGGAFDTNHPLVKDILTSWLTPLN